MKGIRLEPARSLLDNFTHTELSRLVKRSGLKIAVPRSRAALADLITKHLDIDEIVEGLRHLFPAPRATRTRAADAGRLDLLAPLHGSATVHVFSRSRPQLGRALLARTDDCMTLSFNSAPLFLEN